MKSKEPNYDRPPLINQIPDMEFQKQLGRMHGEEIKPKVERKKANPEICWGVQKPEGDVVHAILWGCPRNGCPEYNVDKSFDQLLKDGELVGVVTVEESPFERSDTKKDHNYVAYCKCKGCKNYWGQHMFDPIAKMIAEQVNSK